MQGYQVNPYLEKSKGLKEREVNDDDSDHYLCTKVCLQCTKAAHALCLTSIVLGKSVQFCINQDIFCFNIFKFIFSVYKPFPLLFSHFLLSGVDYLFLIMYIIQTFQTNGIIWQYLLWNEQFFWKKETNISQSVSWLSKISQRTLFLHTIFFPRLPETIKSFWVFDNKR